MYEFATNNKDTLRFGFQYFEGDESYSIRSVALSPDGRYAFFSDACHGNVKRLDLKNGVLKASRVLDRLVGEPVAILFDIAFLNNLVYVTTSRGIAILNGDLDFVGFEFIELRLPSFTDFSIVRNDSVCVEADIEEREDKGTFRRVLVLVGAQPFVVEKAISTINHQPKAVVSRRLGKRYQLDSLNNNYSLRNQFGCFLLPHSIPNLDRYFTSRNLDFNSKGIIYFDITLRSVVIYSHALE
jgi:hypothetical protein